MKDKVSKEYIVRDELSKAIQAVEDKEDEYSKNIYGYKETAHMDVVYEEYVAFLVNLKEQLRTIREILG